MRNTLLSLLVGIAALGISSAQTVPAQAIDATGVWLATDVPYTPWTVHLKQDGTKLTGTVQQNGGLPGPVDIYEGTINGGAISFKAKSPDGARAITFTGTIRGNEITLNRSTQNITDESQGGTGLFGTNAAPQFTIKRGVAATNNRTPLTTSAPTSATRAATTPTGGAPVPTGPAGRWQATAVPNAPWTFEFTIAGTSLTGTVQQGGVSSSPVNIAAGKVDGTVISFRVLSPDSERMVAFNGRVNGSEISFVRQITVIAGGTRGGNDLYGGSAPLQFVANRATLNQFNFKGVEVDVTSIQSAPNRDVLIDQLRRQIDIIDKSVTDPAQKAFLKSVPLVMAASPAGSDNAAYSGLTKSVVLTTQSYSPDKPVILHELMHAYHDQKLPNGFANDDIQKLYQQARTSGQFPASSYMLSNVVEYFAMVSSVYLCGSAARDPFTRQALQEKQPDCYQWLLKEFGPR